MSCSFDHILSYKQWTSQNKIQNLWLNVVVSLLFIWYRLELLLSLICWRPAFLSMCSSLYGHILKILTKSKNLWAVFLCLSSTRYMEWPTICSKTKIHCPFQKCFENFQSKTNKTIRLRLKLTFVLFAYLIVVVIICTLRMCCYYCNHHLCMSDYSCTHLCFVCDFCAACFVYLCCVVMHVSHMFIYVRHLELILD